MNGGEAYIEQLERELKRLRDETRGYEVRVRALKSALEEALRYVPAQETSPASRKVWLDGIATLKGKYVK